jgi:aspartyl protease family protein
MSINEKMQSLQIIVLLIVVIASFLYRKKYNKNENFKNIIIWLMIVSLILILYSFKNEGKEVFNRVYYELSPSVPKIEDRQIIITKSNDGHFYMNTQIRESNIRFMIDTGASAIVLSQNDATKIGIDILNLSYTARFNTANGVIRAAPIVIRELIISDDIFFRDLNAYVSEGNDNTSLLGMTFLSNFNNYSFEKDKLYLKY